MKIKTLVGVRKVENEMGGEITLAYYLTEETRKKDQGESLYGAGIVKKTKEGEESEWLDGLSHIRERAEGLLACLMQGAVTPLSMAAVTDDLMADCVEP